jgi:hypothetical protein
MRERFRFYSWPVGAILLIGVAHAQSQPQGSAPTETAEISLRKSIVTREYQGRQISGEERAIVRGDSIWRILIQEKGVPEKRFQSYLVVIRGLNPQVRNLDVLRAGEKIFIPLKLDEGEEPPRRAAAATDLSQPSSAGTENYRVKTGDYLLRVLRERYKDADERKIAQYFALVKDLNPHRQDWETLLTGEVIRLPALDPGSDVGKPEGDMHASAPAPAPAAVAPPAVPAKTEVSRGIADATEAMHLPAREHLPLFMKVAEATGSEVQSTGEESISLPDGTVRFDRAKYPVIYNAALRLRVVIDPDGKIPPSLKAKLNDPRIGTPVLPMANGQSIAEAIRQLLAGIGYQPLPTETPVVVHEAGVTFEAKGNWVALAPAVSNRPQEIVVINLTDRPDEIPEYLTGALARRGVLLHDVVLPHAALVVEPIVQRQPWIAEPVKELPKEKRALVDALLLSFQVPFRIAENISVELRDGLRIETRVDRLLELDGKSTAIFFRRTDPVVRQALQEKRNTRSFELDLDSLSSREVIFQVLSLFGEQAAYREHRFPAAAGLSPDRLSLKAWGFNVKKKPMFLTDHQLSPALQRFFFEKGLEIVYFQ